MAVEVGGELTNEDINDNDIQFSTTTATTTTTPTRNTNKNQQQPNPSTKFPNQSYSMVVSIKRKSKL